MKEKLIAWLGRVPVKERLLAWVAKHQDHGTLLFSDDPSKDLRGFACELCGKTSPKIPSTDFFATAELVALREKLELKYKFPHIIIPAKEEPQKVNDGDCRLGWACYEVMGAPIYKADIVRQRITDATEKDRKQGYIPFKNEDSLTDIHSLTVGEVVAVPSVFGWSWATVRDIDLKERSGTAASGKTIYPLHFANDDRNCWTCCGSVNTEAIAKLTFNTK